MKLPEILRVMKLSLNFAGAPVAAQQRTYLDLAEWERALYKTMVKAFDSATCFAKYEAVRNELLKDTSKCVFTYKASMKSVDDLQSAMNLPKAWERPQLEHRLGKQAFREALLQVFLAGHGNSKGLVANFLVAKV